MKTPITTELFERLMKGEYGILVPDDGVQFTQTIEQLTFRKVYLPKMIMQAVVEKSFHSGRKDMLTKSKYFIK